ncbi:MULTISPECIES: hypothetical protein [unclassified Streptomyces]|uniref:hypothetical protein n=1 Tax=unclassified Streptomyces TaxID=2593676 RepID=UPI00225A8F4A|nr:MULTISPECIES: hypothetical protein [unclassified Streptomyces]MCX5335537.1 hypothetical protein [Streptomyces sp. NBC_00140]MCX5366255.1 hypothetical protein [Streptomyces sp. NBC_00124]
MKAAVAEAFGVQVAGRTRVNQQPRPPTSVGESMDAIRRGDVEARIVSALGTGR